MLKEETKMIKINEKSIMFADNIALIANLEENVNNKCIKYPSEIQALRKKSKILMVENNEMLILNRKYRIASG